MSSNLKFSPQLKITLVLVVITLTLIKYRNKPAGWLFESEQNTGAVLDTVKIISGMHIIEDGKSDSMILADKNNSNLLSKIDTVDFTYMAFGDAVPDWCRYDHRNDESPEGVDSFCVYMESASHKGVLNNSVCKAGNQITFIGRYYKDRLMPPEGYFGSAYGSRREKGYIFRYYSWKVHRPFTVWYNQYSKDSMMKLLLTMTQQLDLMMYSWRLSAQNSWTAHSYIRPKDSTKEKLWGYSSK
jgi:hypothetical protein